MNNMPRVAALLTTYNAEDTVRDTLKSVEAQNYDNMEVWVYDDASTDDTPSILQDYKAKSDYEVNLLFSEQNTGHPYQGMNEVLDRCDADLVGVIDHDDLWHPQKTIVQVQAWMDHDRAVGVGSNRWIWYQDQDKITQHRRDEWAGFAQHTTLLFENRDGWRYPLDVTKKDMAFQKNVLCQGKNKVFNVQHPLCVRRVRDEGSSLSDTWSSVSDLPRVARRDGVFEALYESYNMLVPASWRNWLSHRVFKPHLSQEDVLDVTWTPVRLN